MRQNGLCFFENWDLVAVVLDSGPGIRKKEFSDIFSSNGLLASCWDMVGGEGAEVAPPCDMNYFNSSGSSSRDKTGYRSHYDMADAFNAGLEAMKK